MKMCEETKNTLLVVDDENVNLKVLNHILGNEYTIYTAKNGTSAIEKTKEYKPDLILLDIIMPGMDGYQTLNAIRENEEIKKIPVIFITGLDSDEDEEKGLSLGAADYITKPFSAAIVKLRVQHQIRIINQLRTIERLSLIDQLTNIPNRRCFDQRLQIEWKMAIREKAPISLLMIDIDNFKNVNDTYGHQQGDKILQMVAKTFTKAFRRPADFAARWGGEEFIILLPNTHREGAMEIAEKIRDDIEKTETPSYEGEKIKITISIGVNSLVPAQNSSLNAFISNADEALYAAKEAGKNKVSCI
jgi:diguanylate cyclase (GGDEF)-like protein